MTSALERFASYEMKTSVIKIIDYEKQNFQGFFSNCYYDKDIYFANLTQLIFLINDLHNALSYPNESMEARSFTKESSEFFRPVPEEEIPTTAKVLATFKIDVLFRQNASWQGSVAWVEKEIVAQFRSALELVILMDSVLTAGS